jgi:hypothetical protein
MTTRSGNDAEIEIVPRDGYTAVRFLGKFSVAGFQRRAEAAAQACRDGGTGRLFVDASAYDVVPTILERYELASHAVKISAGLRVALVVDPAFFDPNKFGITVAQNRGLTVDAFTDRQTAVDWLLASPSGDAGRATS